MTQVPLRLWLAYWRLQRRIHRYTVEGLEHLVGPQAKTSLIVGYHGRPAAYDLCILTVELYEKLGYLPHALVHRGVDRVPPARWLKEGLGFFTEDDEQLEDAVTRGEHVLVAPGGGREASRPYRDRYRVHWSNRLGYLRLALRYGLHIVPVGASGVDHAYLGLNDGTALGRRLRLPRDFQPLPWLALGPLGFFPLSPPFPFRIRQLVGEPIDPAAGGAIDPDDRPRLLALHGRVQEAVQELLDRARMPASVHRDRTN